MGREEAPAPLAGDKRQEKQAWHEGVSFSQAWYACQLYVLCISGFRPESPCLNNFCVDLRNHLGYIPEYVSA